MPCVACPSCGLPRTAADAGAAPCPACGWRVGDPLAPHEPEPLAGPEPPPQPRPESEPEPHRRGNLWLVVALAAAGLGVLSAGGKNGSGLLGGSRLTATARTVLLYGPVTGRGTAVELTLTPPGRLVFGTLNDAAVVRYRVEHRADPPPRVTAGTISGGAEFKEEMPP